MQGPALLPSHMAGFWSVAVESSRREAVRLLGRIGALDCAVEHEIDQAAHASSSETCAQHVRNAKSLQAEKVALAAQLSHVVRSIHCGVAKFS